MGGVSLIGALIFGGWKFWQSHQNTKAKDVALVDMVKTVEMIKPQIKDGWDTVKKTVVQMHNPSTQNLIKLIKDTEVNTFAKAI